MSRSVEKPCSFAQGTCNAHHNFLEAPHQSVHLSAVFNLPDVTKAISGLFAPWRWPSYC